MSISSLAPAAMTLGWCASMATAGSFCLFCEKGPTGLAVVTSTPPDVATAPATPTKQKVAAAREVVTTRLIAI